MANDSATIPITPIVPSTSDPGSKPSGFDPPTGVRKSKTSIEGEVKRFTTRLEHTFPTKSNSIRKDSRSASSTL
jgi:hypothetical protein